MSPRHAFQSQLDAQLADWSAKLADMQYQRRRHEAARARLEGLRCRSEDHWEDLKPLLERQWEILGNGIDHSLRWFREETSARKQRGSNEAP